MPRWKSSPFRRWHRGKNRKVFDLIPVMIGKKPWWTSKTLHGAAMVVIGIAARRFGWNFGAPEEAAVGALLADLLEMVGAAYATYGRLTAKQQLK